MSVFDPRHFPDSEEELTNYGVQKIQTLIGFYGSVQKIHCEGNEGVSQPDVDREDTEAEWKVFRRVIFIQHKRSSLHQVLIVLLNSADIIAAFPNLAKLAAVLMVLTVTTATVEHTFNSMKLIKTWLRNRMGESTLNHTMRVYIKGPECLSSETLEEIIQHYKQSKKQKLAL